MQKFAANLSMLFQEHAFLDRFAAAKACGFEAVEFLFPYEFEAGLIAEKLATAGLRQVLFNLPPGDWAKGERGLAALPDRKQEFRQSVDVALAYAKALGTPQLHVMAGIADWSDGHANGCYRDSLRYACERAGAEGIGITIEPLNKRDMPGYFLNDFDRAAELISDLDLPNLKLQFDIYHRQIIHGDVLTGLRQMMPMIGHVQIASVPDRNEPGSGELDDFAVLRALDSLGYPGYVGCEYRPANGTVEGLGWMRKF
ncbi:MAG: 2-oxo-tetronate isomerase [Rhizobiaceae bacterium]